MMHNFIKIVKKSKFQLQWKLIDNFDWMIIFQYILIIAYFIFIYFYLCNFDKIKIRKMIHKTHYLLLSLTVNLKFSVFSLTFSYKTLIAPDIVSWSRPIPPGLWIAHIYLYTFIVMVILVKATCSYKWVASTNMLFYTK